VRALAYCRVVCESWNI